MIFPPAFLDSSSWNDNQHQHHQHQQQGHQQQHQVVTAGGGGDPNHHHELLQQQPIMGPPGAGPLPDGGGGGVGQVAGGPAAKPMSMAERARLARIPLPEPGLKCPRCDSTNTKFCYFNNYSLTQPRHFCRACRRYWTRGGALRNVPVGGGYRRHAKRAKPKQAAAAAGGGGGASANANANAAALHHHPPPPPAGSTCTATTTTTTNALPGGGGMLGGGGGGGGLSMLPPLLRLADFDAMSLGSTFSAGISSTMGKPGGSIIDAYSHSPAAGLEQWRVQQQMQSFPFLHAMDGHHQGPLGLGPPLAMAMAAAPGMFQLGLDTTTTSSCDNGHGRGGGGGGGEDGSSSAGEQPLHMMQAAATKRESFYPAAAPRGMYNGDHHGHGHLGGGGYTSAYSTNAAATGNHLL